MTDSVTSRDGTTIGYRRLGHGPGVVLLHGAMSSAHNHLQLAEALADAFTVQLPDRRQRGLSGPYGQDYSVRSDVEDLDAVLAETGAHNVFGVSTGAVICLEAARTLPAIKRVGVYEPPLFADSATPTAMLARFDREMAQGKVAAALVTAMKGTHLGPSMFEFMPRWLLARMTAMMMSREDRKGAGPYLPLRELAGTLHYDGVLLVEASGKQERFSAISAKTLLLGGSKSSAFLKSALDVLERVLPDVERVELPGLDHSASWNADRGGKPEPVANEVRRFFA